jgi:hypothetical protein
MQHELGPLLSKLGELTGKLDSLVDVVKAGAVQQAQHDARLRSLEENRARSLGAFGVISGAFSVLAGVIGALVVKLI